LFRTKTANVAKKLKKPGSVKKASKKKEPKKAAAHKKKVTTKTAKAVKTKGKLVPKAEARKESSKKINKKTEIKRIQQPKNKPETKNSMPITEGKKRLIISYEKLPSEVIDVIRIKYPYGYNHDLKEVKCIDNKKFVVLPIELP